MACVQFSLQLQQMLYGCLNLNTDAIKQNKTMYAYCIVLSIRI